MPEEYKEADRIIIQGTTPEIEDRFRDLLRVNNLEKGLSHAIKVENYEVARILQGRKDAILKKYEDEVDDLNDLNDLDENANTSC